MTTLEIIFMVWAILITLFSIMLCTSIKRWFTDFKRIHESMEILKSGTKKTYPMLYIIIEQIHQVIIGDKRVEDVLINIQKFYN